MTKNYKLLNHTTDLEIKAWGKDLPELFSNMAQGMFKALNAQKENQFKPKNKIIKTNNVKDYEMLLVNFLNELWYQASSNKEIYQNIQFNRFSLNGIEAKAIAIPCKSFDLEIKSATYFDLKIKKEKGLLTAKVILDI